MSAAEPSAAGVGFAPDEIDLSASTRDARLKWVVVVDQDLPAGRAVNAAVCTASATSAAVSGLLGPEALDADGGAHPGLPWAGCSILAAPADRLRAIRAKADRADGVFVADMPESAQEVRVYSGYLGAMASSAAEELSYCAVSIVGPRNKVAKLVGRLPLLP